VADGPDAARQLGFPDETARPTGLLDGETSTMTARTADVTLPRDRTQSWLSREATIAKPGFNRWLVPPAALAIHLAIGQAYAFSVFNKPLGALISGDVTKPAPDDWTPLQIGITFSIAIVLLGLSAALGVQDQHS
jgi:hypothetical protein